MSPRKQIASLAALIAGGLLAACNVFAEPGPSCERTSDCDDGFVCHAEGKFCERDTGPIVLGYLAPNETQFASQFIETERAVALAVERVNFAGGVLGRKVTFKSMSDRPTELAVKNAGLLADERVAGIVGPTSSTPALAMQPLLRDRRIVAISPGATSPELDTALSDLRHRRELGCSEGFLSVPCEIHYRGASSDLELDDSGTASPPSALYRVKGASFEVVQRFDGTDYDRFEEALPQIASCK